jgi:transposase
VLAPGRTHKAHLWAYCGDSDHALVLFDFTWTQSRAGPKAFLGDYEGYLQADAHKVYDELYKEGGPIVEVGCWAHARRKFFEAQSSDGVYAKQAVERIRALYMVERQAKGKTDAERLALRKGQSVALLEQFFVWAEEAVMHVLPESPTGKAFGYALNNRKALERYCEDAVLDIDNNEAERALRGVAVGRKNWMFAGSARGGRAAAIFFSLIESAKRAQVNVFAYMRDILERVPGHKITHLSELFPENWKQSHPECVTASVQNAAEADSDPAA